MRSSFYIFALIFLCLPAAYYPQTIFDRDVVGRVEPDPANESEVRLLNTQNVVLRTTRTTNSGLFQFAGVPEGSYLIVVTRPGFSPASAAINVVTGRKRVPTRTTSLTISLSLLLAEEQVTVTADTGVAAERRFSAVPVNVISHDAIRQRTTAVLAQAANEEAGISLQRTSPTIGAVLVRGLTEVGVYVDGIRYTNSTQRGGINTFFNLNEHSALRSIEVQRSPNTAQFGSDGLGGNLHLNSRQPDLGLEDARWNGELAAAYTSADRSFGGNAIVGYGSERFGVLANLAARSVNTLRPGRGLDGHSAITRFLGLRSDILGIDRLPDTEFTQYSGTAHLAYSPSLGQHYSLRYQRSQQDGGKRYDQLLGGDGNLIADLRNLMLDFGYLRYLKQGLGPFDNFSAAISFNSQREERVNQGGQGNPLGIITNDKERTTSWGGSFYLDKQWSGNHFLVGGDHYYDSVLAPSFNTDPASRRVSLVRPRVPNGSSYALSGIYIQHVVEPIKRRVRVTGALRYNLATYRSSASRSPLVNGVSLFPDDAARFADFSGRIGVTATLVGGLNAAFNYSRGFRAPNITSLGSLGLVGVGYQVSTKDVAGLGATIGSTADATARSTGIEVVPLRSETSDSYDLAFRYRGRQLTANLSAFIIDYGDAIVRQTLILPQGATGLSLGSQSIIAQNTNGAVFVALSTSPVLVQTNFNNSRISGMEFEFAYQPFPNWLAAGNYSYVYAEDRSTGEAPNLGGGGIPPQYAFLSLRYQPSGKRFWAEVSASGAGRQHRLSSLDLADRRTGAARSRSQIQNFFRRGACVRGITTAGSNGQCGSAGGTVVSTGESLSQVMDRVLPLGSVINGVLIANNDSAAPLFSSIPGYFLANFRSGYRVNDKTEVSAAIENLFDQGYRAPGWGIDGPGRSVSLGLRYSF